MKEGKASSFIDITGVIYSLLSTEIKVFYAELLLRHFKTSVHINNLPLAFNSHFSARSFNFLNSPQSLGKCRHSWRPCRVLEICEDQWPTLGLGVARVPTRGEGWARWWVLRLTLRLSPLHQPRLLQTHGWWPLQVSLYTGIHWSVLIQVC